MSRIERPGALAPATIPWNEAGACGRAAPRPFHLACVLPDLSGGGVERMRLHLLEALRHHGIRSTLLLGRDGGALRHLVPDGVEVRILGGRTAAGIPRLARFLRRARPDALLSSLGHNNVASAIAKVASATRTRLVICQHNALSAEARAGGSYGMLPLLLRIAAPVANGIVAVSHGVADDMARTTGIARRRIEVIPNPVVTPALAIRAAAPLDDPWFAPGAPPVFVTAGRLVAQKDHAMLLRAFALRRKLGVARLVVLGEGPLRAPLERQACELGIAADVRFEGFVANPLPYVRRAAAFVLTSLHEGFGNVLVEALACGTPVISTDCPHGPSEILGGGRWGVLAPPGDHVAFGRALAPDLRARFPSAALRSRAETFSVERAAKSYLRLLRGEGR